MRVGEPVVGTGRLLRVSHMARPVEVQPCVRAQKNRLRGGVRLLKPSRQTRVHY